MSTGWRLTAFSMLAVATSLSVATLAPAAAPTAATCQPRVAATRPSVDGTFAKASIHEASRAWASNLGACVRAEDLEIDARHEITVEFDINTRGSVTGVWLSESDFPDATDECVRAEVDRWRYPTDAVLDNHNTHGPVHVVQTFIFVP